MSGPTPRSDAAWPGANGRIVYAEHLNHGIWVMDADGTDSDQWTANADGTNLEQIPHPSGGDDIELHPDWQPTAATPTPTDLAW
ncbi:MAG TPA: hypothetical protein VMR52_09825 [Dehalococcoidia bacterium]|nr:hypothetical protein [Dehalococcoidia bacterium]